MIYTFSAHVRVWSGRLNNEVQAREEMAAFLRLCPGVVEVTDATCSPVSDGHVAPSAEIEAFLSRLRPLPNGRWLVLCEWGCWDCGSLESAMARLAEERRAQHA